MYMPSDCNFYVLKYKIRGNELLAYHRTWVSTSHPATAATLTFSHMLFFFDSSKTKKAIRCHYVLFRKVTFCEDVLKKNSKNFNKNKPLLSLSSSVSSPISNS